MEKLQLKELVDIYLGVTHTPKYVYAGVPFLSVKDISGGQINFDNCKYISEEEYNSLSQGAKPQVGDMLFCRVGTIGKPIIIPKGTPRFGSFVSLGYLRNKDNSRCRMDYLKHWMNSKSFYDQVQSNVKGASQVNLNTGWLSKFEVRLPDYREQSDIVATLDLCERIINNRNLELQKLDNLIKARFVEMFGYLDSNSKHLEVKRLEQLGSWNSGGTPSRTNPAYFTGSIDWYSAGELNSLFLGESVEKITKEAINNSAAKLFKAGSMLVGMYDTAAFKMGILKKESSSNQACACIEPNEQIDIVWLYYALTMMKERYLSNRRGGRQKNLNLGMIKGFELPVPQKKEQLVFVSFVKQVDKSKVAVQKALDEAQLLFDSLMQEYFG